MDELRRREGLYACVVEGERYDIGTPKEFVKTVVGYGLGGPYGEELRRYLKLL
jgi:UTP-glucose-1-phosphate uridylyltransferase